MRYCDEIEHHGIIQRKTRFICINLYRLQ